MMGSNPGGHGKPKFPLQIPSAEPRAGLAALLAELGEAPAFVRRARTVAQAWQSVCKACRCQRNELLRWPSMRLAALSQHVRQDLTRLSKHVSDADYIAYLQCLFEEWKLRDREIVDSGLLWASPKRLLVAFARSVVDFNRDWTQRLHAVDLNNVNALRRDYNEHYPVEKACAFRSEYIAAAGFEPLPPVTTGDLIRHFPLLTEPPIK